VWSGVISKTIEAATARSLLSAAAVRSTSRRLLRLALAGSLADWTVHMDRLPTAADYVASVVRERYPSLQPPLHARWRHFVFAGRDLWAEACAGRTWRSAAERARAAFDLAITSVLLDAGAGADWHYTDAMTGLTTVRSEGLALAGLRWFARGGLSGDAQDPLRADAPTLARIDQGTVEHAFQVSASNPLQGGAGRAALLNRLGAAVQLRPDLFSSADAPRPGGLFDALALRASAGRIAAATLLELLLEGLGAIWPDRPTLDGVALGDCWPHPALGPQHSAQGFVPLHKLSQWLAYSLIEPLEAAGITVTDLGALTGLAEYRNGGLFVDLEVIVPREPRALSRTYAVADPFIVGWRSLTVALLDDIAPLVASRLELSPQQFPLPRVLEGGTWAAGRRIARAKRSDGGPPLRIRSDGTVF
jgi:hypothetical protein